MQKCQNLKELFNTPRNRINTVTPLSEAIAASTLNQAPNILSDGLVVSNGAPFLRIQQVSDSKPSSPEKVMKGEIYPRTPQGPVLQTVKANMSERVNTFSPSKRLRDTPRSSIVDRCVSISPSKRHRGVSRAEVRILSESVDLDTPSIGNQKLEVVITSTPVPK